MQTRGSKQAQSRHRQAVHLGIFQWNSSPAHGKKLHQNSYYHQQPHVTMLWSNTSDQNIHTGLSSQAASSENSSLLSCFTTALCFTTATAKSTLLSYCTDPLPSLTQHLPFSKQAGASTQFMFALLSIYRTSNMLKTRSFFNATWSFTWDNLLLNNKMLCNS